MDVKFEIQDLFEKLRPNAKIHETLEEAAEALNEIVTKQMKAAGLAPESTGEVSDELSEKSDDEQEDHRQLEEEEIEEDEEKPDDVEVVHFLTLSDP